MDKLFFSSLEAFPSKIQLKTLIITLAQHDFCQIACLLDSTVACVSYDLHRDMLTCKPIKYDRTCQRSIKIISIEKTFTFYKSAQKKHFFLKFF